MRRTAGAVRALLQQPAEPDEHRGDAGGPLEPAHAGREQRIVRAVLHEPPAGEVARHDRALHEGVAEHEGEGQVLVVPVVLPAVKEGVGHAGGAATATVVVPEARVPPRRDSRAPDRTEALPAPGRRRSAGDLFRAREVERGEEERGPGRPVAPAPGQLVLVGVPVRDVVGHGEPRDARSRKRHDVLRSTPGRLGDRGPLQDVAGDGQRGGDAGRPVREVRHLRPPRHQPVGVGVHGPGQAGRALARPLQQHVGGAMCQGVVAAPETCQQHARGPERHVVERRPGPSGSALRRGAAASRRRRRARGAGRWPRRPPGRAPAVPRGRWAARRRRWGRSRSGCPGAAARRSRPRAPARPRSRASPGAARRACERDRRHRCASRRGAPAPDPRRRGPGSTARRPSGPGSAPIARPPHRGRDRPSRPLAPSP